MAARSPQQLLRSLDSRQIPVAAALWFCRMRFQVRFRISDKRSSSLRYLQQEKAQIYRLMGRSGPSDSAILSCRLIIPQISQVFLPLARIHLIGGTTKRSGLAVERERKSRIFQQSDSDLIYLSDDRLSALVAIWTRSGNTARTRTFLC